MSVATAIGAVSTSLRTLLDEEMDITPNLEVTILGPDEPGADQRVNLFLYQMRENAELKNLDWQASRTVAGRLVAPPLSLNLFYVMTAFAPNQDPNGDSTQHEILGDAMRVFYENPIVPQAYLHPQLIDARERIKIMLNPLDMEEIGQVWATFSRPFRLSVLYEVSVVQLDMLPESERTLPERVRQIGVPRIETPFRPPSTSALEPPSGPVGTAVTVRGNSLQGWRAYLTITGIQVLQSVEISNDDHFEFTVPAGLLPGFHEVRVDISHLSRATFFFEVTP